MPYSFVTRTPYGADAIDYARGHGKGHNGAEERNLCTAGVNLLPDEMIPFDKQMQPLWDRADPRHKIQVDRFTVSFSPNELDPNNPDDVEKALAIGQEIAMQNTPDCQSAIFVQSDGRGGKLHIHIDTNDVRLSNGKGVAPKAYYHPAFSSLVDKVCSKYFALDVPELAPERTNPSVRGARIQNEQIREANAQEIAQAAAEGRPVDAEKIKQEKYIWQDDLKERIKIAASEATDEDSFAKRLRLNGVELVPKTAKDGTMAYLRPATNKQPAHYVYELVDVSGFDGKIPPNLKSKSFKLGANYQPEGVAQLFQKQPQEDTTAQPPAIEPSQQERDKAKGEAMHAIWPPFAASMGWETGEPDDKDEAKRRIGAWNTTWTDFIHWRIVRQTELNEQGDMLPSIFNNHPEGNITINEDTLIEQFSDYLYDKRHQKPKTQTEPPRTPPQDKAAQQRQKIAAQRAALTAELERNVEYINEQARKRKDEDDDYTRK